MKIIASRGIAIVSPLEEKKSTGIQTTTSVQGRVIRGRIIAMAKDDITTTGTIVPGEQYGKVGDIVYFMHYFSEGGADQGEIDGKLYYFVKWGDLRAIIK